MSVSPFIREPSEFGFGDLFSLVSEAVIVADATSGAIQLWNDAAARLFGYTAEQAVGMPVAALVPEELRDAHRAGLSRFADRSVITLTPPGTTVEVPALSSDGSRLWVELSLTALQGDREGMALALIRDVTDRRQAQDDLSRANEAMRNFVAVAAHDLRSPTAAIVSGLEMLRDLIAAGDHESTVELTTLLERQARDQLGLIEDLLDTASLDAGAVRVQPEVVMVADAIAALAEGYEGLTVEVPAGLTCRVDRRHFDRIVTNLLTNAYRHGAPPVQIEAIGLGSYVEVTVSDAGPGVPADLLPRLFDAYVSGRTSRGTGLGLSIARGLARANGGDLTYEHDDRRCFALHLPAE